MFSYKLGLKDPVNRTTFELVTEGTSDVFTAISADGDRLPVTLTTALHSGDGGSALVYFIDPAGVDMAIHVSAVMFGDEPVARIGQRETKAEQNERHWDGLSDSEKEFFEKPEVSDPEASADYADRFDLPTARRLDIAYLEIGGTRYV